MADEMPRWAERHSGKDALRREVWSALEREGVAVGPAWGRIPDVLGADAAAARLAEMPEWAAASVIKCNPDRPQIPVRLRALQDGKTLYAPVPELRTGIPFVRLDPAALRRKGVAFDLAATSRGSLAHGEPVDIEDMPYLPFCVVGCVAATRRGGRTGKGGGFADLELGIFRDLGKIDAKTIIATTVHSSQIVAEERVAMQPHDWALDVIATERDLIRTDREVAQPAGIDWDAVRPDQFAAIPVLAALRVRRGTH